MKSVPSLDLLCVCQSGAAYSACCQPLLLGKPAANAQALMRSRYSAYVLKLEAYLLQTWHPDTRPDSLDLNSDEPKWLGLQIKYYKLITAETATVEFIARYKSKSNGKAERMHELSRFVCEQSHWYYVDGDQLNH